jgi:hypothetical protein
MYITVGVAVGVTFFLVIVAAVGAIIAIIAVVYLRQRTHKGMVNLFSKQKS